MLKKYLATDADTVLLGQQLATVCISPCKIFLQGELGSGKTTLARSFLQHLGYQGLIKSPTYTLVEPYKINDQLIFHFDLYRIKDPRELEFIGIHDYFTQNAIFIIEWPERGQGILPPADLTCYIEHLSHGRQLQMNAETVCGTKILEQLKVISASCL